MANLLPILRKLRQRGVRIVVNTRSPDEHDTEFASQAIQSIAVMQDIGVTVLFTGKHHRKLAIIDVKFSGNAASTYCLKRIAAKLCGGLNQLCLPGGWWYL